MTNYIETKTGSQSGSNAGGFYRGSDGVDRYVKFYTEPLQVYCEAIANAVYNDLGIDAPKSHLFKLEDGRVGIANDLVDGKLLNQTPIDSAIAQKILEGFYADVFLANWDVIGLAQDNMIVNNGRVIRIDNGGSLCYRAVSGRKSDYHQNTLTELAGYFEQNFEFKAIARKANVKTAADVNKSLVGQICAKDYRFYVTSKLGFDVPEITSMLVNRANLLSKLLPTRSN